MRGPPPALDAGLGPDPAAPEPTAHAAPELPPVEYDKCPEYSAITFQ